MGLDDLVPVHSTPRWNVVQRTRIGRNDVEQRAGGELLDPVLRTNDGQRADQSTGIELFATVGLVSVTHATPPELDAGDAYRFSLYHLMDVDRPDDLFPITLEQV